MSSQAASELALRSVTVPHLARPEVNRGGRTAGEPTGWSSADVGDFAVDWEMPHVRDEMR